MKKRCLLVAGIGLMMVHAGWAAVEFTPLVMPGIGQPIITSIRLERTNLLVVADVPPGFRSITLEGCQRLNGPGWTPKAVGRVNGAGGLLRIELSADRGLELLRIRGTASEDLPDFFFAGQTLFTGQALGNAPPAPNGSGTPSGTTVFDNGGTIPAGTAGGGTQGPARTVTESDIWKLQEDTLYFFNQYRGLQVIDVSHPDAPVVLGSLPLAASGEQMYLLDTTHVVLLTDSGCGASDGQVIVVELKAGQPTIIATLPIIGSITESRLVGTALYVASTAYQPVVSTNVATGTLWGWSTEITSFDLSQPNQPIQRSINDVPSSYSSVVAATDRFLFVAGDQTDTGSGSTWKPVIHICDISAPDGAFAEVGTVTPYGQVADKFKMNLAGDVFSVVSAQWNGSTMVETFSLANPGSPQRLGSLSLTVGESLFATRFDSNRLYAVTFHQVDPLWIVDLSDGAHPRVAGKVQVPGFSTYLYPWGDRLLAVGRESTAGSQTTVSLFDVQDPSAPLLLSRVMPKGRYSYSEANYDEKAFGVLPELGLVLLPFTAYADTNTVQGVQLIDLNPDSVVLRGWIPQDVAARRATVHRNRILALSGLELLSVDATDRDHPVVRSATELSWSVDQVFLTGGYLLELDYGWSSSDGPQVRVAPVSGPDQLVNQVTLTNLPILGAAMREGMLYVAQGQSASISWPWDPVLQTNVMTTNSGVISLTVLDISHLPQVTGVGQTQVITADVFAGNWKPLWPKSGLLVWAPTANWFMPWLALTPVGVGGPSSGPINGIGIVYFPTDFYWPWWGWGTPLRLIAFDITDHTQPALVSDVALEQSLGWGAGGQTLSADSLVYSSHREYEWVVTGTNYVVVTNTVFDQVTNVVSITNIIRVPQYTTATNYVIETNLTVEVLNQPGVTKGWHWPTVGPLFGTLAAGGHHSLVVDPAGSAWSWGAAEFGQLGNGSQFGQSDDFSLVAGLGKVNSLAAGYYHSLAVDPAGNVWAWGGGFWGQLGNGIPATPPGQPPMPYNGSPSPVQALGVSNIINIAAGAYHSLALSDVGTVWAWGANESDQVGCGSGTYEFLPQLVTGLTNIQGLAGGCEHSLALGKDGTVWAWGANEFGQLGNGWVTTPCQPGIVPGLSGILRIAAGHWHSLALKSDGTVWGWGRGDSGQLGDQAGTTNAQPIAIPGLTKVAGLSAGMFHSLALASDGTVWSWGDNNHGQLGRNSIDGGAEPAPVPGVSNALAVAAGAAFSLALTVDGTLWGWGDPAWGELGAGERLIITNEVIQTNVYTVVTYLAVTNIVLRTNITSVSRLVVVTNEYPITTCVAHDYLDVVDYTVVTNPVVRPPVNIPGPLQGISHNGLLLYSLAQLPITPGGTDLGSWLDACAYDGVQAHLVDSLPLPNVYPQPVLIFHTNVLLGLPAPDTNSMPKLQVWTLPNTGKFTQLAETTLPSSTQQLAVFGDLVAASTYSSVQLLDLSVPTSPKLVGGGVLDGCIYADLEHADGSVEQGLYLALGQFGAREIDTSSGPVSK